MRTGVWAREGTVDRALGKRHVSLEVRFLNARQSLPNRERETRRARKNATQISEPVCLSESAGEREPTWIARYFFRKAKSPTLAACRERVRAALLEDMRCREHERVLSDTRFEADAQEREHAQLALAKEGEHGGAHSQWERLWDAAHGQAYWQHWGTGASAWVRPHVCHVCDNAIDAEDALCFHCNSERSEYNKTLYQATHDRAKQATTRADDDADDDDDDDDDDDRAQSRDGDTARVIDEADTELDDHAQDPGWFEKWTKRIFNKRRKTPIAPHPY